MNISNTLIAQARAMLVNGEDWVVNPDGIDQDVFIVCAFDDGAWVCIHGGECDMSKFEKVQKIVDTDPEQHAMMHTCTEGSAATKEQNMSFNNTPVVIDFSSDFDVSRKKWGKLEGIAEFQCITVEGVPGLVWVKVTPPGKRKPISVSVHHERISLK